MVHPTEQFSPTMAFTEDPVLTKALTEKTPEDPLMNPTVMAAQQIKATSIVKDMIAVLTEMTLRCQRELERAQKRDAEQKRRKTPMSAGFPIFMLESIAKLQESITLCATVAEVSKKELWQLATAPTGSCAETVDIKVSENRVLIRMPMLPPRIKPKGYMGDKLLAARLANMGGLPYWKNWTIRFCHVYPSSFQQIPRDADNFYYKRTVDIIALMMGTTDSAGYCSIEMDCSFTDSVRPGTYIQITPKSWKNDFIFELENVSN